MNPTDKINIEKHRLSAAEIEDYVERVGICVASYVSESNAEKIAIKQIMESRNGR